MAKRATPELKAAIRRYHRDGWSYTRLAAMCPYGRVAIARWCDAEFKQRQDSYLQGWSARNGAKVRDYKKKSASPSYRRQWRQANKDKTAAQAAKARADRAQATPPWLTKEHLKEIESFYTTAKALEQAFDGKYEVDHIFPIKGEMSCGLHVPWNLQVLPASKNREKSNKLPS